MQAPCPVQCLERCLVACPQVAEQGDQVDQADHFPSHLGKSRQEVISMLWP